MVLLLIFLILPFEIHASQPVGSIAINEFMIEPEQKVEITNSGSIAVDLSGWHIDDDGGSTYFTVPNDMILPAQSCMVFSGNFNLNKASSDRIRLFNAIATPIEPDAVLIDEYTYSKSPGEDISYMRDPDGIGDWTTGSQTLGEWNTSHESCLLLPSTAPTPSPGITPRLSPEPTPTATFPPEISNVYLSEIMVAPTDGEKEWIELYNDTDKEIVLTDWYIDDIEDGGSNPKKFSIRIPAKGYRVYELSNSIFNNSEDAVRLLNSNMQIIDVIEYEKSEKGMSLGWNSIRSQYFCLQFPSKGAANNQCKAENISTNSDFNNPATTKQIITPTVQSIQNIPDPSSSYSKHLKYTIMVTPPVYEKKKASQLTSYHPPNGSPKEDQTHTSHEFIAQSYSLLSILSLTVKMKLKGLFS